MVKFLIFLTMLKRLSGQKHFRNGSLCRPEGYLAEEIAYIVQNDIILPLYYQNQSLGGYSTDQKLKVI